MNIFLFHKGNPWYFKYTVDQLRFSNPDATVYFVGDETNALYDGVNHVQFNSELVLARTFSNSYRHLSDNQYDYELICFLRWFYIYDVVEKMEDEPFFYIDSDVLVYEDLRVLKQLIKGRLANTVRGAGSPAICYFNGKQTLKAFVDYCLNQYTTELGILKIVKWHELFKVTEQNGGVCDMTIFQFFDEDHPGWVQKIERPGNQLAVDTSLRGVDGFEMKDGLKALTFRAGRPFGKDAVSGESFVFVALHFQGDLKHLMPRYYRGQKLKLYSKYELVQLFVRRRYSRFRWFLSKIKNKYFKKFL